jgi:hypothetical protein
MNNKSQSKSRENVLSLQLARHHAGHERAGSSAPVSNAPVGSSSNERSLERLEAENALLRRSVVDLMLQLQASRDALGHTPSEIRPNRRNRPPGRRQ